MSKQQKPNNSRDVLRFAGLGAQIFVSLGIAVLVGYKADDWLGSPIPLLVWVLPLAVLCMMIYKLIKETSKNKDKDADSV